MPIRLDDLLKSQGLTEADVVFTGQPMQPRESTAPQRGIPLDELLRREGVSEYAIQGSPVAVATPQPQKPSKLELIAEAYRRGILPEDKRPLFEEAVRRGLIASPTSSQAQSGQPMNVIWDDEPPAQSRGPQPSGIVWDDEQPGALLHQQVQQIAKMTDGDWLKRANDEIRWREQGITLKKIDNRDGTFTYQQQQTTPQKLSNSEKQAIYDTYRKLYSFGPERDLPEFGQATRENLEQIQGQFARQDWEEAQRQGATRNFLKATTNTLAQLPAGIVDAVSGIANRINRSQGLNEYTPGTLSESINQQYNYNPESVSGFAGMVTGNAIPMLPGVGAAAMGAKATAQTLGRAYLGAGAMSQFGNVVADVAQRRAAGENISDASMYSAAFLSAAAEILGEKLGLDAITDAVANPAIRKSLANRSIELLKSAGINATEEGVTQVMQNAVTQGFIDPNQMLTEGVGTAMAAGGVTGAAVPLLGRGIGRMAAKPEVVAGPETLAREVADESSGRGGETTVTVGDQTAVVPKETAPTFEQRYPVGATVEFDDPGSLSGNRKLTGTVVGYKTDPVTKETFAEVENAHGRRDFGGDINNIRRTDANTAPVEALKPTAIESAPTDAPADAPEALEVKRLPEAPLDLTQRQLLAWAQEAGYDTTGLEDKGKRVIHGELAKQRLAAEQQARPQLPDDVSSWDAGRLRRFAEENGYMLDAARLQELADQGLRPRQAVQTLIEEQYARPKGQGPVGATPQRLPSKTQQTPPQRGLPELPPESKDWKFAELKQWATTNGYQAGSIPGRRGLLKALTQQRNDSLIDLPQPPKAASEWTFKQFKWWALQSGYDVGNVTYRRQLTIAIEDQRQAALQAAQAGKQTLTPQQRAKYQQELAAAKQRLKEEMLARRTDPKTGAPNEIQYIEDARRIFADADARGESVALVETDVGGLKVMNTVYGHAGGDAMLQMAHEAMAEELRMPPQKDRPADYLGSAAYRIGGDEFPAILRGVKSKADVKAAMDRINARFEQRVAERFPDLPAEARPFLAWDAVIRKPGDKTALAELRKAADAGVEAAKSKEKARRSIPEGRTDLLAYIEDFKQKAAKARQAIQQAIPIAGSSHQRHVPQSVEEFITPIDSRVRDLSPRIYDRLSRMQFDASRMAEKLKRQVLEPISRLTEALGGQGSEPYQQFALHVFNQQFEQARAMLPQNLQAEFDTVAHVLDELHAHLKQAGVDVGYLENYWPRSVKDFKGLKAAFGGDTGPFEEAWELARQIHGRRLLTAEEKAAIANSVIQGYGPRKPGSYGPKNVRERGIEKLTKEHLPYYADPMGSLLMYIDGATYAASRSRFLGKNPDLTRLGQSVGRLVAEEAAAGHLNASQQEELIHLLQMRFTADLLAMSKAARITKQVMYAFSLGQFRHAFNQIMDVVMTAKDFGVGPTLHALKLSLGPADHRIMMEELGIHDHGEEFKDVNQIAKSTDLILSTTGFKRFDRLGKEVRINAARLAFERAAKRPESAAFQRLERDYRPVLGDQFQATMEDFRRGRMSENAHYLLYLDLTGVQPVSLNQMPAQYLAMRNGRILYSMKSFTLRQADYVRRTALRKLVTPGQRREGLRELARLLGMLVMAGMGKDLIMDLIRGKPVSAEQIPTRVVDSTLGLVGLNTYTLKKLWSDPVEGVVNLLAPPLGFFTSAWKDATGQGSGQSLRYAPLIGELFYYWFGHGATLNAEAAKRGYREKLKALRAEIQSSVQSGDLDQADKLLTIYNERRTQGPGDGRQSDLSLESIYASLERKQRKQEQKEGE